MDYAIATAPAPERLLLPAVGIVPTSAGVAATATAEDNGYPPETGKMGQLILITSSWFSGSQSVILDLQRGYLPLCCRQLAS